MSYILVSLFIIVYGAWCFLCPETRMRRRILKGMPVKQAVRSSRGVGGVLVLFGAVCLLTSIMQLFS